MDDAMLCPYCRGPMTWTRDVAASERLRMDIGPGGAMLVEATTCATPGCKGNATRAREAAAKLRDLMGRVALGEVVVEGLEPDPRLSEALAAARRLLSGEGEFPPPAAPDMPPENPTDFVAKYIMGRHAERMEALLRELDDWHLEKSEDKSLLICRFCGVGFDSETPAAQERLYHFHECLALRVGALLAELDTAKATP